MSSTNSARKLAAGITALTGAAFLAAGPVMLYEGIRGRREVSGQLAEQEMVFPDAGSPGLPEAQAAYGGQLVTTGLQARAFADMIETHVRAATGGRSYSQVSDASMAAPEDDKLAGLKQTAFMGETLRGSLMGAYQAWEVTNLVIGLGAAFTGLGAAILTVTRLTRDSRG